MGWVWRDDEDDDNNNNIGRRSNSNCASNCEECSTRKIVRSQCKTEEVEPGKFIRRCEKTEELLKDCIGRPVEVVESNTDYTEEDVTNKVLRGGSTKIYSPDHGVFDFPGLRSDIEVMKRNFFGLRSDIEVMERNLFGGLSRFMEAAEEMRNGFFDIFGGFDSVSSSSPSERRGIPIEEYGRQEAHPKPKEKESTDTDFVAMAKDV